MDSHRARKRFCSGTRMRASPTRKTAMGAPVPRPNSSRYCLGIVSCPFSPIRLLATYSTCDWLEGIFQLLVRISYHSGYHSRSSGDHPTFTGMNKAGFFLAMSTMCAYFADVRGSAWPKQLLHAAQVSGVSAEYGIASDQWVGPVASPS